MKMENTINKSSLIKLLTVLVVIALVIGVPVHQKMLIVVLMIKKDVFSIISKFDDLQVSYAKIVGVAWGG